MRVIIIGCGRVGSQLANALSAERHEVVVIDANPQSFSRLSRDYGGRMLTGIGFDREVLLKAGIEDAQALAATTDSDNANIVAAVTAKETFRVPRVVARIYDAQAAELYRREGIPTVTPTLWAATTMKTMITNPRLTMVAALGNGEVECVTLEADAALAGQPLEGLGLPAESVVGAVVRRGQAMLPAPGLRLEAGDQVYLTVAAAALPALERRLDH